MIWIVLMWYSGVGYVFLCSHYGSSSLEWEFDTSMIGGRDGTVIVYPHASLKWVECGLALN